jgi:hypothetical protein
MNGTLQKMNLLSKGFFLFPLQMLVQNENILTLDFDPKISHDVEKNGYSVVLSVLQDFSPQHDEPINTTLLCKSNLSVRK